MKRFHVHLSVSDINESIRFYSQLFAAKPMVIENDYAKWMLDDPRVNFAISTRSGIPGVDHLGIQTENSDELNEIGERLAQANTLAHAEPTAECCYAKSEKLWAIDPQGIRWESFHTTGALTTYHGDKDSCEMSSARAYDFEAPAVVAANKSCCEPKSTCC